MQKVLRFGSLGLAATIMIAACVPAATVPPSPSPGNPAMQDLLQPAAGEEDVDPAFPSDVQPLQTAPSAPQPPVTVKDQGLVLPSGESLTMDRLYQDLPPSIPQDEASQWLAPMPGAVPQGFGQPLTGAPGPLGPDGYGAFPGAIPDLLTYNALARCLYFRYQNFYVPYFLVGNAYFPYAYSPYYDDALRGLYAYPLFYGYGNYCYPYTFLSSRYRYGYLDWEYYWPSYRSRYSHRRYQDDFRSYRRNWNSGNFRGWLTERRRDRASDGWRERFRSNRKDQPHGGRPNMGPGERPHGDRPNMGHGERPHGDLPNMGQGEHPRADRPRVEKGERPSRGQDGSEWKGRHGDGERPDVQRPERRERPVRTGESKQHRGEEYRGKGRHAAGERGEIRERHGEQQASRGERKRHAAQDGKRGEGRRGGRDEQD